MKKYYCDICSKEMNDERHMLIPIQRFDGKEELRIHCKDRYGYCYADICKSCETKVQSALNRVISDIREIEDSRNNIGCSTCEFGSLNAREEPCCDCDHGNGHNRRYTPKEQNTTELYFDDTKEEVEK